MDELERHIKESSASRENILKYVDQYSIFSYYIGNELETRTKYSSPLREGDDDPSFSIWWSDKYPGVMLFKDSSTGRSGDVFVFLRCLMGNGALAPERRVLYQINKDFNLGLEGQEVGEFKPYVAKKIPMKKFPVKIQITEHLTPTQKFTDYWGDKGLEISQKVLDRYYVANPRVVHYISDIHKSIVPSTLTISYEILGHYKIYHPFEDKKFKFRNNYLDMYVEGAIQLQYKKEFAIITKSTKDIIFFRQHFDWDTVAGTSENTMISPYFMTNTLLKKYKYVFIWLDPDEAGIAAQQKYLDLYPELIPIEFDPFIKQKDPTDLFLAAKKAGKEDVALRYMKQLVESKL